MITWKQYRQTFYEVSNLGDIKTIPHVVKRSNGRRHNVVSKILKPALDKKGYLRVGLMIDGDLVTLKVHRIVCECFHENPLNLPQVNHKDGNKQNNNEVNLEWSTASANVQHAFDTGLTVNIYGKVADTSNFARGTKNSQSKLDEAKVKEARELRASGKSYQSIADKFGVNKKTMIHAITGITWKI